MSIWHNVAVERDDDECLDSMTLEGCAAIVGHLVGHPGHDDHLLPGAPRQDGPQAFPARVGGRAKQAMDADDGLSAHLGY